MSQRQKMFEPLVVIAILKKIFGDTFGDYMQINSVIRGHLEINDWTFDGADDQMKIRIEVVAEPSIGYIEVMDIEVDHDNRPSSIFFDLSGIYHLQYMQ